VCVSCVVLLFACAGCCLPLSAVLLLLSAVVCVSVVSLALLACVSVSLLSLRCLLVPACWCCRCCCLLLLCLSSSLSSWLSFCRRLVVVVMAITCWPLASPSSALPSSSSLSSLSLSSASSSRAVGVVLSSLFRSLSVVPPPFLAVAVAVVVRRRVVVSLSSPFFACCRRRPSSRRRVCGSLGHGLGSRSLAAAVVGVVVVVAAFAVAGRLSHCRHRRCRRRGLAIIFTLSPCHYYQCHLHI
jgi:hypothetical protein